MAPTPKQQAVADAEALGLPVDAENETEAQIRERIEANERVPDPGVIPTEDVPVLTGTAPTPPELNEPGEPLGENGGRVRCRYPVNEFHHSVAGVPSPVPATGVDVDSNKVDELKQAAATAGVTLEVF